MKGIYFAKFHLFKKETQNSYQTRSKNHLSGNYLFPYFKLNDLKRPPEVINRIFEV